MEELNSLLRLATAGITQPYFRLPIAGGAPVFRERVYCYHLYHQLRRSWPNRTAFMLNGEVDKRAHPILARLGESRTIPDLLVCRPGDMSCNHAVLEVKSEAPALKSIVKDLTTLSLFVNRVGYERAIYLVFGERADRPVPRIEMAHRCLPYPAPIEVWVHKSTLAPAERLMVLP